MPMHVEYDLSDEENLPSPFLKRGEKQRRGMLRTTSAPAHAVSSSSSASAGQRARAPGAPRKSSSNLRAVAAMNAAHLNLNANAGGAGGVRAPGMARAVTVSGGLSLGAHHGGLGGRAVVASASASALGVRSSIAKAQRASEEARRALRPREVVV